MLKSVLSAVVVFAALAPATQAVELVSGDGSELSSLCVAAVKSDAVLDSAPKSELKNIQCNGMPITRFVKKYRALNLENVLSNVAFENADNTSESALCIAAATSNEAYAQTKNTLFASVDTKKISCNGKSIAKFAKQFNKAFNG